ncbi:MAG: 2-phosphosulfolactate phosphatase [Flavobacteriales bacterium]|nr:2-phosphosulfolactate phosphatase [Flavobacteriales bacterium]MBT5354453.1 2-phosphosulfolactate phosphatase [Flavobacteriales bacterium]MBT6815109.1 2-phosphosulfolactate phosphatase [Flavobacteriales bacterium]
MRRLNVCLTSDLFHHYDEGDKLVLVVDILRATSVISTAFHYGISELIPVSSVEQAKQYMNKEGYIVAAERNAEPIEGIPLGNSPFQYMNDDVNNKRLVLTTTNGTKSIKLASKHEVISASFVNQDAVYNFIMKSKKDVVVLCSGWKGLVNMEDSIFAGILSDKLLKTNEFQSQCDSVLASVAIKRDAGNDLFSYLEDSAHRNRLKHLNMEADTKFCLNPTFKSSIIPILKNGKLIPYEK